MAQDCTDSGLVGSPRSVYDQISVNVLLTSRFMFILLAVACKDLQH